MKRLFIILALILFMTGTAFSKPKDYFSLDAEVQFKLDDSDINGGRYYVGFQLEGELEAKLRFNDRLYATLAVEIDRKDVDPKEASVFYWIDEFQSIKGGLFDSSLTMNDFLKKKSELFFYDSPGVKYIKDSGFTNIDTGVEYSNRHILGDKTQLDAAFFFNSGHNESQFFLTGYYNFTEGLDFIAFTVSYLPYVGSNLIDPVGYLHFPGEDDSWFASADLAFGYNFRFEKFVYTPALRAGILCPDIKYMDENRRLELMLGNWFYGKYVFVHLDGGLRFDTYKSDSLKTKVKPIWGINFCVKS